MTILPTTVAARFVLIWSACSASIRIEFAAARARVTLPDALDRKYPDAAPEWAWQWVFPVARLHVDAAGRRSWHHLHETVLQLAFAHR